MLVPIVRVSKYLNKIITSILNITNYVSSENYLKLYDIQNVI